MQAFDKIPDQSWQAVVNPTRPAEVEAYLIDEIFKAMGLGASGALRALLGPLFTPVVRGFAKKAAAFDRSVSQKGFQQAAQEWLSRWISSLEVVGREYLASTGPLLIAANHPGTFDGLAVASVMPRQDIKIVTAANPFFRALPNTRRYFIYSTLDAHVRMATIRNALRHLLAGGALLIFPSGKLDPDPLYFREAARQAINRWSASLSLFLRKAPETRLILAINSGFVASEYINCGAARLQRGDISRQKLAEFIQVIQQVILNRRVFQQPRVVFSKPLEAAQIGDGVLDFQEQIIQTAFDLLDC